MLRSKHVADQPLPCLAVPHHGGCGGWGGGANTTRGLLFCVLPCVFAPSLCPVSVHEPFSEKCLLWAASLLILARSSFPFRRD